MDKWLIKAILILFLTLSSRLFQDSPNRHNHFLGTIVRSIVLVIWLFWVAFWWVTVFGALNLIWYNARKGNALLILILIFFLVLVAALFYTYEVIKMISYIKKKFKANL